ncbi:MAG: PGF-pre-PGF domain-containing protein, partial [Candidatus Nanohaloarchaea archaeon]|nr:PGF-pre-PGF domain-containing protein [Candidatus Nanohaloarchaea archaeon]
EERGRNPGDVVLKRYNQQWMELPTEMTEELENSYRFRAESTGFSYYAIALREKQQKPANQTANIQVSSLSLQPEKGEVPFQ